MQEILLVSMGAILGVNSRYLIYQKLYRMHLRKEIIILIINILASFFLGLFLSLVQYINYQNITHQLLLFFATGFLGSLSTFSTFIYDLFDLSRQYKFDVALKLIFFSLAFGISAFALGFSLAK